MTHIKFIKVNGWFIGFNMEGHAGFNPGGPDILCASLSTASIMTINGIANYLRMDAEDLAYQNQKDGIIKFEVPYEITTIVVQHLLSSFEAFVKQLEAKYEGYVSVECEERSSIYDKRNT